MSETGFLVFNVTFALTLELLYGACLALFLGPFLSRRRTGVLVLAAYLVLRLLWDGAAIPQGMFGVLLVGLPVLGARGLGLDRGMAFLLALLYWNVRTVSGLMCQSLFHLLEQGLPPPPAVPEAIYLRSAGLLTVFLLSHTALLALMLCFLQKQLRRRPMTLHRRELCYLSLVPTAGILFGQVISRLLQEFQDGVYLQLYQRHPAFLAVIPVLALLFYAGTYLSVRLQQGLTALREEQAAHAAELRQVQALRTRIHEAEAFYGQLRGLKHQLRGHLSNLRGLAHQGAYDRLEDYLTRMDESLGGGDWAAQTGDPVTDMIVGDAERRCLEAGVRFQADFRFPGDGGYDAFDLGIILQNLLENALEACGKVPEGERYLTLTGRRRGRFFLLEVKNPYAGQVVFGPDGLPLTTKTEDAPLHGLGLTNARREAEKYTGQLELRAEGQVFTATVLLQERSQNI